MTDFDLPEYMLVAGRSAALEVVLEALGVTTSVDRQKHAASLATRVDLHLHAESGAQKLHPAWARGVEEIQQALQRIADNS